MNPIIGATIMNRDTAVIVGSIQVKLNGALVDAAVEENGVVVSLTVATSGLPAGSTNVVEIQFTDAQGTVGQGSWSFAVSAEGTLRLESSLQVTGPYAWEPAAIVDVETQTIRVALTAQAMFYRLSLTGGAHSTPVGINSISFDGPNVVFRYSLKPAPGSGSASELVSSVTRLPAISGDGRWIAW
jgi:hypothetical protein